MNQAHGNFIREFVACKYSRNIGDQHSKRCSGDNHYRLGITRGHCYCRDLRFVAHLRQKESDRRRAEHAKMFGDNGFILFDFIRYERPDSHSDEGPAKKPAQYSGIDIVRDPGAKGSG